MQPDNQQHHPVYIARQPILDHAGQVFGYELLYRANGADATCEAGGDVASANVFTTAVLTMGLEMLTNGRPAFVNLTRSLLLNGAATVLPAPSCILEISSEIVVDDAIVEACRRLQDGGYTLALDHYTGQEEVAPLLPFVKFVKVDVQAVDAEGRASIGRRLMHRVRLIAVKVETAEVFEETKKSGYCLFQGFFFCRPTTVKGATPPARRLLYLRLLAAINQPNVTLFELEELIKQDVSLCYRVLRCINSAAFGLQMEIHSIRQALVLLGVAQVRKWASVWSLASAAQGTNAEVLPVAIIRARCCEILGDTATGVPPNSGLFLLGMCSLLDAMLGRPMAAAVAELPLAGEIRAALLGRPNMARSILDVVIAYERGEFDAAASAAAALGLPSNALPAAYNDALRYARELSRDVLAA
jgi:EAL and modified HD-GYP domain-containing signal transduction protein